MPNWALSRSPALMAIRSSETRTVATSAAGVSVARVLAVAAGIATVGIGEGALGCGDEVHARSPKAQRAKDRIDALIIRALHAVKPTPRRFPSDPEVGHVVRESHPRSWSNPRIGA